MLNEMLSFRKLARTGAVGTTVNEVARLAIDLCARVFKPWHALAVAAAFLMVQQGSAHVRASYWDGMTEIGGCSRGPSLGLRNKVNVPRRVYDACQAGRGKTIAHVLGNERFVYTKAWTATSIHFWGAIAYVSRLMMGLFAILAFGLWMRSRAMDDAEQAYGKDSDQYRAVSRVPSRSAAPVPHDVLLDGFEERAPGRQRQQTQRPAFGRRSV